MSMQDNAYRQIGGYESAPAESSSKWPRWVTIVSVAAGILVSVLVTFYVTKNHYEASTSSYDPSKVYVIPPVYEARLQFRIPYFNFTEPINVRVDSVSGNMRMEYWNGMDTYIYRKDLLSSISMVPVYLTMTCMKVFQNTSFSLPPLFPTLSLFTKSSKQVTVQVPLPDGTSKSVLTDVWTYSAGTPYVGPNNNTALLPDGTAARYSGNYFWHVDAATGQPVSFVARGHNVLIGGSHPDEYIMDYLSVNTVNSIDKSVFSPPVGMNCHANDQPFGPTLHKTIHRSNPAMDMARLFPEAADLRDEVFNSWTAEHGKTYNNEKERQERQAIFHSNLHFVHATNRKGLSYTVGTNHMSDWTREERLRLNGRVQATAGGASNKLGTPVTPSADVINGACKLYNATNTAIPQNWDWRDYGKVLPPGDQGTCGSCFSYGAAAAIEGAYAMKYNKIKRASSQSFLDCTWFYGNNACDGGMDYLIYAWILQQNSGSVADYDSYGGYLNQDGFCHYALNDPQVTNTWNDKPVQELVKLTGCYHVTNQWNMTTLINPDEATRQLRDALYYKGPLSVSIDATLDDFYYYTGGNFNNPKCGNTLLDLDHTVSAVAYKYENGQYYTLLKNSWSTNWGMGGYAWVAQSGNICGVATSPTFVSVA